MKRIENCPHCGFDLVDNKKYNKMFEAATEFYKLLEDVKTTHNEELLKEAERKLNEISLEFSEDPAYAALLKMEMIVAKGKGEHGDIS